MRCCLRYESVAEAHHVYPLSLQFDAGETSPVQDSRWLCPTHHRLMHEIIEALTANRQPRLDGVPIDEREKLDKIGVLFAGLWKQSRRRRERQQHSWQLKLTEAVSTVDEHTSGRGNASTSTLLRASPLRAGPLVAI